MNILVKKRYNFKLIVIAWFYNKSLKLYYKATFSGNKKPIALNYNSDGYLSIILPQGPDTDAFKLSLFVNIIDDTNGITVYNILKPVVVLPNDNLVENLVDSIASNDENNQFIIEVNSGNLNLVSKNIIALTSIFNAQSSLSTKADDTNLKAMLREYFVRKLVSLSLSDISSVKVISSALSEATGTPQQVSTKNAV